MIRSWKKDTIVWVMKPIDIQNTIMIAASFGTKVSVIYWMEVNA
jgi:hypothetical protein